MLFALDPVVSLLTTFAYTFQGGSGGATVVCKGLSFAVYNGKHALFVLGGTRLRNESLVCPYDQHFDITIEN